MGWGAVENGRLHWRRRKDALSERGKAEHLDMDKRALKEPLFSSSWRHLAKESPKHLNFSTVLPTCCELTKSHVWLSQNSSDVSVWGRTRGPRGGWEGGCCVSTAQTPPPVKANWVEAFGKLLNSEALESCQSRRCGEELARQMTSLSPTYEAPNYCNPRESARPPSSVPSSSLNIALI